MVKKSPSIEFLAWFAFSNAVFAKIREAKQIHEEEKVKKWKHAERKYLEAQRIHEREEVQIYKRTRDWGPTKTSEGRNTNPQSPREKDHFTYG